MHPCEKTKKKVYNFRNGQLPCICNCTQILQGAHFLEILLNYNIHVHALSFAYKIVLQFEDITGNMILFNSIIKQGPLVFFVH